MVAGVILAPNDVMLLPLRRSAQADLGYTEATSSRSMQRRCSQHPQKQQQLCTYLDGWVDEWMRRCKCFSSKVRSLKSKDLLIIHIQIKKYIFVPAKKKMCLNVTKIMQILGVSALRQPAGGKL